MSASLASRRLFEVRAKLKSLDEELRHWKELTEAEDRGLRRHHSQVARIATVIETLTEPVRKLVLDSRAEPEVLENVEEWENQILAAHSIWEVFRSKFVLREDALFRDVLAACDDLLWACYGPAIAQFAPDRKGPPLVYFTSTWSPFAMARDSSFQNEVRSGRSWALTEDRFFAVLGRLPIPLVSLPWYNAFHLPGALILAHECGHIVESDFALTADIAGALDRAALANTPIWKLWAAEVFADLYGCLMMGPAFAAAMMDLLSISTRAVQTEERKAGKYPTRALRVECMLEALMQLRHGQAAEGLRSDWEATYGTMRTMTEFKPDVAKVVSALLEGPYKGIALPALGPFPGDKGRDIAKIGEAAAGGFTQTLEPYGDPRLLFAGAQWIHENGLLGEPRDAYMRIVNQVARRGAGQFRMRGEPVASKADLDAGMAQWVEADRNTGRELQKLLQEMEKDAYDETPEE